MATFVTVAHQVIQRMGHVGIGHCVQVSKAFRVLFGQSLQHPGAREVEPVQVYQLTIGAVRNLSRFNATGWICSR